MGSLFRALGASNHSSYPRESDDFYATSPQALRTFLAECGIKFNKDVWECACGKGHLSEVLKEKGYNVKSTDIVDRDYKDFGGIQDFLEYDGKFDGDVLTNPPYKYAKEFIQKALDIIPNGKYVVMLLRLAFLEGKTRKEFFKENPPRYVCVCSSRILIARNGDFEKFKNNTSITFAWFIWEKGYKGAPEIKWIG